MDALLLVLASAAALLAAYLLYARWLARRVFNLDPGATTPAHTESDDRDYVPTARSVVFGHHFTSIAGTGPIVGPAIAVMWGWLPAVLWIVLGAIFIGAVHDLASLVISLRNRGRSIGDIAGDILGPRARLIFLAILIVGLWIVLAVFGLVIAAVLRQYPAAITPVLAQVPVAVVIGLLIHRRGRSIVLPSVVALALMYAAVLLGDAGPLHAFNQFLAAQPLWAWTAALLAYAYAASVLPVWTLLQPRDYINALQLITTLVLIVAGLVTAALIGGALVPAFDDAAGTATRPTLELVGPMIDWQPTGAPPLLPVLFITIACGACSGFHCLVASGTTSKQLTRETHAKPVGYGSMLTEGFLATLVVAACAAGIGLGTTANILDLSRAAADRADDPRYHAGWYGNQRYSAANLAIPIDETRHLSLCVERQGNADPPYAAVSAAVTRSPLWIATRDPNWGTQDAPFPPQLELYAINNDATISRWLSRTTPIDQPVTLDIDAGSVTWRGRTDIELDRRLAFNARYSSWQAAGSLANKVSAFVDGAANFLASMGIPLAVAAALIAVMVASFAATTMDTACRLQRYVVQELARTFFPRVERIACPACTYDLSAHAPPGGPPGPPAQGDQDAPQITCPECGALNPAHAIYHHDHDTAWRAASPFNPFKWLATVHGATLFAVLTALALAFIPPENQPWSLANAGQGGLLLWPLFGATNQLLAGFAFVVILAWLVATRRPRAFAVPGAVVMLVIPASAMTWQAFIGNTDNPSWLARDQWVLVGVAAVALALELWLIAEAVPRVLSARWLRGARTGVDL